jgi:leucyl-tRNA synthetase
VPQDEKLAKIWKETFVKLLHPFAPHLAEEIWYKMKSEEDEEVRRDLSKYKSLFFESWPEYDEKLAEDDVVNIAVQVM